MSLETIVRLAVALGLDASELTKDLTLTNRCPTNH